MTVEYDKSFEKSLIKIRNRILFRKLEKTILEIEKASALNEVRDIKKLVGFSNYYRIRIGEYRLGFEKINEQTIRFIFIAQRKDIYKLFP